MRRLAFQVGGQRGAWVTDRGQRFTTEDRSVLVYGPYFKTIYVRLV